MDWVHEFGDCLLWAAVGVVEGSNTSQPPPSALYSCTLSSSSCVFASLAPSRTDNRARCDALFRTDLAASCEYLHGATQNWRARECESTAHAYYAVARSFGRTYYTGTGDAS